MKSIYKIILVLLLFTVTKATAQQDPNYTFYRYNMNLINPAYAGANETTDLGINIRSQWANLKGAPKTQSFIFGTALGHNVGLGLSVINDKTFIEKQTSVGIDFSYRLKLNEAYDLFFGLKAGFNSYDANTEGLITYDIMPDPKLTGLRGKLVPNFGVGIYLKHKDYFLAFSIPQLLNSNRLKQENGTATVNESRNHSYFTGGYNFTLGKNLILKPSVLVRYIKASPLSVDLTAALEFNKKVDFGAAYRVNENASAFVAFRALKFMQIGYAYEIPLESSIRSVNNGTHEIMMRVQL